MKGNRRLSLIDRFVAGKHRSLVPENSPLAKDPAFVTAKQYRPPQVSLSGPDLENAYRELMLENQMLSESNERLHERLARIESGMQESPAAQQLIRAQRNALAERSHRLREVQYENLNLKRERKKLARENQKLAVDLQRYMRDIQPLLEQDGLRRRELDEAKAMLREKSNELARLTDRYYQLEARTKPVSSASGGT